MKTLRHLSKIERRAFVKGALACAPVAMNTAAFRYLVGGLVNEAYAHEVAVSEPTFFIEINLRDQWDFGHVFIPKGIATATDTIVGTTGRKLAMFYRPDEIREYSDNFFLTPLAAPLVPHLNSIAVIELCEMSMGTIHGHEAANAVRSPGRSYLDGIGRLPMWDRDPHAKVGGNENHYSATPTPACLHNHAQRYLTRQISNGYTFKGGGRAEHTVYHFPHLLALGDVDRFQSESALLEAFRLKAHSILPSSKQAANLTEILKKFDRRTLLRAGVSNDSINRQMATLDRLPSMLFQDSELFPRVELTEGERAYWDADIPAQQSASSKLSIGLQMAYVCKLFKSGLVRTASIEFDYSDVHDERTKLQLDIMAKQTVHPLARCIAALKEAGLYERTLIMITTLDGGRSPAANSFGSEGKNSVILAGGKVKGGYYGDISVAGRDLDGHSFRYHPPDIHTGVAHSVGTLRNDLRIPGAAVWKTVAKINGVADSSLNYSDVSSHKVLRFLSDA